MSDSNKYTLADALNAQKALREATGEAEEPLELEDVVGISGEEIEILLDKEKSWDDIAAVLSGATGKAVTGAQLEEAYNNLGDDDEWEDD
ncbi:MAG: hypothetical protein KTR19_03700 [Hyphomicrobiales bacterium]|nr:hypothetical protein [Hyphomicrobiales bacterium]